MFTSQLYDNIPKGWEEFFQSVFDDLIDIELRLEKRERCFSPLPRNMFAPFYLTHPDEVKVVLVNRCPTINTYRGKLTDPGLALSQDQRESVSRTSRAIHNNLARWIPGYKIPNNGCKLEWGARGCFLLNISLTIDVETRETHEDLWFPFVAKLIRYISKNETVPFAFFMWRPIRYMEYVKNKDRIIQSTYVDNQNFEDDAVFVHINEMLGYKFNWQTTDV